MLLKSRRILSAQILTIHNDVGCCLHSTSGFAPVVETAYPINVAGSVWLKKAARKQTEAHQRRGISGLRPVNLTCEASDDFEAEKVVRG